MITGANTHYNIQIHYLIGHLKDSRKACSLPLTLKSLAFLQNRKAKLLFSCQMKKLIYKSDIMHVTLIIKALLRIDFTQKIKDSLEEHRNFIKSFALKYLPSCCHTVWNAYLIKSQTLSWAWERFSLVELQCPDRLLLGDLREFQIIKAFTLQKQEIDWRTFKHILFSQSYQKVDTKQWKNKREIT